jgi:outer membrane protein OmpA-like peptidoglycan-associated protein
MKEGTTMHTTATALTVTSVLAALALTACDGPAIGAQADCDQPTALSIIVAAHSNAAPALPAEVACMVRKSIEAGKPISIIREDGEPSVIQAPRVYPVGAASKDNDINNAKITVSRTISEIKANANGDNPIAALEEAARQTAGTPTATIAVISPGLSDQAPLDLTDASLATAVPAEVTAKLKAFKSIPALAGRTVHWYGLGEQHGTQPALTGPQRQNYQDIYANILTTAGAKAAFHPGPASAATATRAAGGRSIRPVPRADQPTVHFPKAEGTKTFTNASALGFLPDSTRFRDPGAAVATGEQLKKWLDENPGATVTVTGTTASAGTKGSRDKLSLARAQAVCALAVAAGADPARLKPIGAGNVFPGFREDILPNGALDPAVAEGNRTIKLHFGV